jgi:signal transduction histidine kinase
MAAPDLRSASLRERIGGRWAVSWAAFLLAFGFKLVSGLLDPLFAEAGMRGTGLLVDLVSFVVFFGGVMWLASISVLRDRCVRPVPVVVVALVGAVAGATAIGSIDWIVSVAGLDGAGYVERRWVVGALQSALTLCAFAYLLDARERFRTERDRLLGELSRAVVVDGKELAELERMRSEMWGLAGSDAARTILDARPSSTGGGNSLDEARSAVTALKSTSDRTLRVMSHGLWRKPAAARLRPMVIVRALAARRPYQPTLLLIPIAVVAILRITGNVPLTTSIPFLAVLSLSALLISLAVNALARRMPQWAVAVTIGSVPVLALSGIPVYLVLTLGSTDATVAARLALTGALWVAVAYPLLNVARGLGIAGRDVVRGLQHWVTEADVRRAALAREFDLLRREVAMHLHGTVRGLLTTSVMRLEFAINVNDPDEARNALAEARALLDSAQTSPQGPAVGSMREQLADLAAAWEGLVDVRVDIAGVGEPRPAEERTILRVVTEGVHDAARHGSATHVEVLIREGAAGWEVSVVDDGIRDLPAQGSDPVALGLGSQHLDAVAPGSWQRVRTPEGRTALTARIAAAP